MRLTSWKEKGLSWGYSKELTGLKSCIQNMVDKKLKLVNVVQVMLVPGYSRANNGSLPCGSSIRRSTEL